MYFHLTARCRGPQLIQPAIAPVLWRGMRRVFPDALAAVIMPDHPHLVAPGADGETARRRLRDLLGGVARECRGVGDLTWEVAPAPSAITDRVQLARTLRYVVLNPCRARLVADPLEWLWTTHRDVVGAVVDPWVTPARLAAALGRSAGGFAAEHHAYVSADPSVCLEGTPFPVGAVPSAPAWYGPPRLIAAAAAATRLAASDLRRPSTARRLYLQLAARFGSDRSREQRLVCGITPQAVYQARAARLPPGALVAGALCLGDDRLVRPALADAAMLLTGGGTPARPRSPPTDTARTPACGRRSGPRARRG